MLETTAPLIAGTFLLLQCGSIVVDAVVVWTDSRQIGINFAYPLTERQMAEQLSRTAAIAARRQFKRPFGVP